MSRRPELQPLPPDVLALLDRTRPGVEPPPGLRDELRARLGPALSLPLPAAPTTPALRHLVHRAAAVLSRKAPLAMLSFGLGAGAGATVAVQAMRAQNNAVANAQPAVATAPSPLPAAAPAPVPIGRILLPAPTPALAKPPTPEHPHALPARAAVRSDSLNSPGPAMAPALPTAVETAPDRLLAAERVLLEKGRSALARGDAAGALAAVAEHAQGFPEGSLSEERDALRIQALLAEGRRPEAAGALIDFSRSYPRSMLTPALRRALQ